MKGAAMGPDVGGGNYGTVVCVACSNANHAVVIFKDANLVLAACTGCGEISAAFKIDERVAPADLEREVGDNRDVTEFASELKRRFKPPPAAPAKEN